MSQVRERVPPQNLEAEQAVIGSMLIEANAVVSALEILRPEDFYKESHRIIFKQIAEMADRLEAVDVVTVAENLRNAGYLDKIGGTAAVSYTHLDVYKRQA